MFEKSQLEIINIIDIFLLLDYDFLVYNHNNKYLTDTRIDVSGNIILMENSLITETSHFILLNVIKTMNNNYMVLVRNELENNTLIITVNKNRDILF